MGLMDFFRKGKEEPVKRTEPQSTQNAQRPAQPSARTYTIKSGDSLSKIAKQQYGNAADWEKIYQANKDKIKDPNMIYPGQTIKIPE